jgi:hypothetical protein
MLGDKYTKIIASWLFYIDISAYNDHKLRLHAFKGINRVSFMMIMETIEKNRPLAGLAKKEMNQNRGVLEQ